MIKHKSLGAISNVMADENKSNGTFKCIEDDDLDTIGHIPIVEMNVKVKVLSK